MAILSEKLQNYVFVLTNYNNLYYFIDTKSLSFNKV